MLANYLRCFPSERPKDLARWLPLAEWWYNTTYHSSIQQTPFEAVYGRLPPLITSYIHGASKVHQVDND